MHPIPDRTWAFMLAVVALLSACSERHAEPSKDAGNEGGLSPGDAQTAAPTRTLAVSGTHACALRNAGLFCWGENFVGQLGTGDIVDSESPVAARVAGTDIVEVALATGRTCVRRRQGEFACWGANEQGQLGDGTRKDALTPVVPTGIDDVVQMAVNETSTCVVQRDRSVACWGNAPIGGDTSPTLPKPIDGLTGIVELKTGGVGGYCARTEDGEVSCWQLEDGTSTPPLKIAALRHARELAMSHTQTVCGVSPSNDIRCHRADTGETFSLQDSAGFAQLAAGNLVICGINPEGDGRCWNVQPQFVLNIPASLPLLEAATSGLHLCILLEDRSVVCAVGGSLALPVPVNVPVPD